MTIQPVKVQPSQIWHVKQCKSKAVKRRHVLKSNRTIVLQRNHTSTKRKKVLSKKFFLHIIPPI